MQYTVLLYVDAPAGGAPGPGSSEWEASLPHHEAFAADLRARGIAFTGAPLEAVTTATSLRVRDGRRLVTDGPFAETKEQLWGYYQLEADDLDTVIDACGRLWELEHGTVEIRPVVAMQPAGQG